MKSNPAAMRNLDIPAEICAICLNHTIELCNECQDKQESAPSGEFAEECKIAWGMCNHAFHFHCIYRCLISDHRNVCPIDNLEWEFQKFSK